MGKPFLISMPFLVEGNEWPIVVLRPIGETSLADWEEEWERLGALLQGRSGRFGILANAKSASPPGALHRKVVADFFRGRRAMLRDRCAGLAVVVANPVVRAAATAVFWVVSPPMQTRFETEVHVAQAWLNGRLSEGRVSPSP